MKTEEKASIHVSDSVYIERVVRHIKGNMGTVRYQLQVWQVEQIKQGTWVVTGKSSHSYFAGGRNARLLKIV